MSHSEEERKKIEKLEEFLNLYDDQYINNLISERRLKQSIYLKDNFDERYINFKTSSEKKFPNRYNINKSKYKLLNCPHCEMSGKGLRFYKFHFEKCVFKTHDLNEINNLLMITQNPYSIVSKFKIKSSKVYKYIEFHNLLKSKEKSKVCPHCTLELKPGSLRFHYSNCKLKNVDIEVFKNELSKHTLNYISKKYNIRYSFIYKCSKIFGISTNKCSKEELLNKNICPNCEQKTNNSNSRFHYTNCKFKDLNINIIKNEIKYLSNYQLNKKYKIPRKSLQTFRLFHLAN
jgi:hypothetical protein